MSLEQIFTETFTKVLGDILEKKAAASGLEIRLQRDGDSPAGISYLVQVSGKGFVMYGTAVIEETTEGFEVTYVGDKVNAAVRGGNHKSRRCELEVGGRTIGYTTPRNAFSAMARSVAKSLY